MLKKPSIREEEPVQFRGVRQDPCMASIIAGIPAYNEEKTIAGVVLKAGYHVGRVLVCDDGSKDMTQMVARKNGADIVEHDRNMGYGVAMQTLFRRARELDADVMVTFDGDGQHDPDEIPALVKPILEGRADIVTGSRFMMGSRRNIPLYRKVGILFITLLTRVVSGYSISDAQSGFRAYSRKALQELKLTELGWGSSAEVFFRARDAGLRLVEVPVHCDYSDYPKALKRDPVKQGVSIVASIIDHAMHEGIHL